MDTPVTGQLRAQIPATITLIMRALVLLGVGIVVLITYKLFPGLSPATSATVTDAGVVECLSQSAHGLLAGCPAVGYPHGLAITFGLPLFNLAAVLERVSGMGPVGAYRLAQALLVLLAFVGADRFFCRLVLRRRGFSWLSLAVATLFMLSPIVALSDGYGALRIGFAMLPTYMLVDVWATRVVEREHGSWRVLLVAFLVLFAARLFALFCDGYSFVMSVLFAGGVWALLLLRVLRAHDWRRVALCGVLGIVPLALTVLAYKAYLPAAHYTPMPLAFFRGQGVDTFFFLVPGGLTWLPHLLGLYVNVPGPAVYSDGPSSHLVYLGYAALACAVACGVMLAKRRIKPGRFGLALTGVALLALLLSLGPELKFHNLNPSHAAFSFQTYLMPQGRGVLNLHTARIYEHVPGIRVMRALYRWVLLVRIGLLAAVALIASRLMQRHRTWLALLLLLLVAGESVPSVPAAVAAGERNHHTIQAIQHSVVADLKAHTTPRERVVFHQIHPHASRNPYMVNLLCPSAHLRCYDVGGDKAQVMASDYWPVPVFQIAQDQMADINVRRVLARHLADAVIVPFFDLRWNTYAWPPKGFSPAAMVAQLRQTFPGLKISSSKWFAYVTLPSDYQAPGGPETYVDAGELPVSDWGPQRVHTSRRTPAYISVKSGHLPAKAALEVDGHLLMTYRKSPTWIVSPFRTMDRHALAGNALTHTLYVVDEMSRRRWRVGQIEVPRR